MIRAERNARVMAEANAAVVKAKRPMLRRTYPAEIEKLRRELYGSRSERKARLLEQMELQLEDLEAAATEDELAAETAALRTQTVQSFQRKRLHESRSPIISRASTSSSPHQKAVPAAARRNCRSWARTLPKRWR